MNDSKESKVYPEDDLEALNELCKVVLFQDAYNAKQEAGAISVTIRVLLDCIKLGILKEDMPLNKAMDLLKDKLSERKWSVEGPIPDTLKEMRTSQKSLKP
jgi:hypothetical protein